MFTDIDIIIVVGITRLQVVDEVDGAAHATCPLRNYILMYRYWYSIVSVRLVRAAECSYYNV